jgi:hypothetical protein
MLVPYRWAHDYGAARQFALDSARKMGADYALTVDPDERLDLASDFRDVIEKHPEADVWILPDRDTGYFKERIIRTSSKAFWHGKVCEFLDGRDVAGARLPGHFWELPKDDSAERRRWERGVVAGFRGQKCKHGARQILQSLHGAQPEEMGTPITTVRPMMTPASLTPASHAAQ